MSTMTTIPTGAGCRAWRSRPPVAAASTSTPQPATVDDRSPINGERLSSLAWTDATPSTTPSSAPATPSSSGARCPPRPRGAGQAARRAAGRAQGRPGHADQPRGRQDHLRGARRGPGDGRHLRLRGRPVPAAVRPHHAVGAPGPPADGDLAPARRRGRHQRVQLPGGRLVLEHRHRLGVRGSGGVEAVRAHAADVAWPATPSWRRPSPRRALRGPVAGADRRRRGRTGAGGPPGRRAAQRDRLDADGPRGGPAGRRPVRSRRCWSSAATTPRSSAPAPTST